MNNDRYVELIRAASAPLQPIATGVAPSLVELADVRAVLFDVFGTLLVSGSGDIGAADPAPRGQALVDALVTEPTGGAVVALSDEFSLKGLAPPFVVFLREFGFDVRLARRA